MQGMLFEFEGKFQEAIETYNSLLVDNPTDVGSWKRKITVLRISGRLE